MTSLLEAAKEGDALGMQLQMRLIVASKIEDPSCPARELASLTKRLHEINREIAELEALRSDGSNGPADTAPDVWDPEAL